MFGVLGMVKCACIHKKDCITMFHISSKSEICMLCSNGDFNLIFLFFNYTLPAFLSLAHSLWRL